MLVHQDSFDHTHEVLRIRNLYLRGRMRLIGSDYDPAGARLHHVHLYYTRITIKKSKQKNLRLCITAPAAQSLPTSCQKP